MRIQSTDTRERLWKQLRDATDHQHTSQALDAAARYYVRMYGDSAAQPTGVVGVDEQQIAKILDTPELGVAVEVERRCSTTPAAENGD